MGTERESTSSGPCVSLLRRLHSPKPSELARKRKVDYNPPPKGNRKNLGRGTVGPKSVSPSQCVHEHPGECLFQTSVCSVLVSTIQCSSRLY